MSDVTIICIIVGVYETLLEGGTLPGSWPDIALSVPEAVHQTSFALSLMLVRVIRGMALNRQALNELSCFAVFLLIQFILIIQNAGFPD